MPAVGGFASDSEAGVAVTAAHDAMDVEPVVGGGARKQRALGKNTRPAVVGAQVSERPRTPSDETMRLDEEIKVLRGQLASRLVLPHFVWSRGSIRAFSNSGPARPYIARLRVL
ncbi:hypothetical protein HNQ75_004539, partial [Rhizobium flavum]|nr:hypothetical protein [Pseudorhizobium flavum]